MAKGIDPAFFLNSLSEAGAILKKYGLPTDTLERAAEEYRGFMVTVPFIGAFNTGKSSAINALLDINLLPTSITANTTVPTEIVYGQNLLTVYRGGSRQYAGLHELRDRTLDLDGVTMLRLELDNAFLRELSGVLMVDMPGLDSGITEHDRAMRSYLPKSLAYILTFSADEPVIKKSEADFLSELRLREMPVYIVLTKCDKVPQAAAEAAAEYLKATTEELLGLDSVEVCRIQAKADRNTEALKDILLRLERMADGMRSEIFSARFSDCVGSAEGYLRQRIEGGRLPASELDGLIGRLHKQGERVTEAIERENRRFDEEKERTAASVRQKVFASLRDSKTAILSTLLTGAEAWPQADRLLIGVLAASVPSEFTTSLLRHLKALAAILDSDLAGGNAESAAKAKLTELLALYGSGEREQPPEEPEGMAANFDARQHLPGTHEGHRLIDLGPAKAPVRAERPPRPQGLDPAARAVLDRFTGTRAVFDGMPRIPVQATRAAKEKAAREALVEYVLPALLNMAEGCIKGGMNAVSAGIHGALEQALDADYAARERALEDIRMEKSSEDTRQEAKLMELEHDLASLVSIHNGVSLAEEGRGDDVL